MLSPNELVVSLLLFLNSNNILYKLQKTSRGVQRKVHLLLTLSPVPNPDPFPEYNPSDLSLVNFSHTKKRERKKERRERRDWRDASAKIRCCHQKLGERHGMDSPSQLLKKNNPADTSI